jgi:hypothetical protein
MNVVTAIIILKIRDKQAYIVFRITVRIDPTSPTKCAQNQRDDQLCSLIIVAKWMLIPLFVVHGF